MPPVQQPEVKKSNDELAKALSEIESLKKQLSEKNVTSVLREDRKPVPQEVIDAFASGKPVKVRATTKGIYPNCVRRKRGDEFKLAKLEDFSTNWHELVK